MSAIMQKPITVCTVLTLSILSAALSEPVQAEKSASEHDSRSQGIWEAPDVTLFDGKKQAVSLQAYHGKTVLAAAWSSWCGVCLQEFDTIRTLSEKHGADELTVLAVNMTKGETSMAAARQFLEGKNAPFPILYDLDGAFQKKFGVHQVPTIFLIDSFGHVIHTFSGEATAEEIENWIPQ
ncbi:TlpA family protein disulfide reductase [Sporolactobacillus sp. THM7-7]|nr:TlpA family protein disulfide reductase [Sporolactobacillus sp. THM7-7]